MMDFSTKSERKLTHSLPFCSIQAFNELDDSHPYQGACDLVIQSIYLHAYLVYKHTYKHTQKKYFINYLVIL